MPSHPRRARLLVKLGLAAGAVVLYLVGLLIVTWVRGDGADRDPRRPGEYDGVYEGIYRPSTDPALPIELIPGANGVVNEDGYVGPRYPRQRTPGSFRVLGLGDSITMYFSAEQRGYLLLAERLLGARASVPVEVLNFGVASYDTSAEVRQLELRGLDYAPDVVTVGYCVNDGIDLVFSVNEATGRFDVDPAHYEVRDVIARVQRAVAPGSTLSREAFFARVFEARQWRSSMQALGRLRDLAAEHDFVVVLIVFPVLLDFEDYAFAPMHEALRERARELGFGFLDLLEPFRRHGAASRIGTGGGDVIHPNPEGHRIAAAALARYLDENGYVGRALERRR